MKNMIDAQENLQAIEELYKRLREPYDNTEDERIEAELMKEKYSGTPWEEVEW